MKKRILSMVMAIVMAVSLIVIPDIGFVTETSANGQRLVDEALSHIGKGRSAFGFTDAWCGRFITYCANQTGLSEHFPPAGTMAGVQNAYNWFNSRGLYTAVSNTSFTPQAGDIVFMDSIGGFSHVGIVVSTTGTQVNVVHGNWGDRVSRDNFPRNGTRANGGAILGFARPAYSPPRPTSTLSVTAGNSATSTTFSWNSISGQTHTNISISQQGTVIHTQWAETGTSWNTILPAGAYEAHVVTVFADESYVVSNVVRFNIASAPTLNVTAGNSATNTTFSWNNISGQTHTNISISRQGTEIHTQWAETGTSWNMILPAGTYEAHVVTVFADESYVVSNVVRFTVASAPQATTATPPVTTQPLTTTTTSPITTTPPTTTTAPPTTTTPPNGTTTPPDTTTTPPTTTSSITTTTSETTTTTPDTTTPPPVTTEPPPMPPFTPAIAEGNPAIGDALEILMFLAGLPNTVNVSGGTPPTINDVLEILLYLAGLPSVFDKRDL